MDTNSWFANRYTRLRRLAASITTRRQMQFLASPSTIVQELYVRLPQQNWVSEESFMRASANTMHWLFIDKVRSSRCAKRGGELNRRPSELLARVTNKLAQETMDLHEALESLATSTLPFARRKADVVRLRFFGGYSYLQIAAALGISEKTVQRDWLIARAWLNRELGLDE